MAVYKWTPFLWETQSPTETRASRNGGTPQTPGKYAGRGLKGPHLRMPEAPPGSHRRLRVGFIGLPGHVGLGF